jgi:hypothetical protein
MKFYSTLIIVSISLLFFSCEKAENSVSSSGYNDYSSLNSVIPDEIILPKSFKISKSINGLTGDTIVLDTVFQGSTGNPVAVSLQLTFEANSFSDTKLITVISSPSSGSIQFLPAMSFNKPAKLDLLYSGINLAALDFTSNSKVDFTFINDSGIIENILKDEVKINFAKQELSTKKALLPHFSRYAFVRKSL